ncbi:response regulator [Streptomyces sp. 900116325]
MNTVLLADGDPAARQGLRTIIDSSPDTRVVAEAWDGRSAVDQARRLLPDVVVMDVRMPGTEGIAATRKLRELPTPPAVLILTTFGLEEYVEQALKAGASGFLIKDTPPAELLSALSGTRYLDRGGSRSSAMVSDASRRSLPPTRSVSRSTPEPAASARTTPAAGRPTDIASRSRPSPDR